jgi:hypothetical protein
VRAHVGCYDHLMLQTLGSRRIPGRTRVIARVRLLNGPQTQKIHRRLAASATSAAGTSVGRHHHRRRSGRPSAANEKPYKIIIIAYL